MFRLIYIFIFISLSFSFEIDIGDLEKNLDKNDIKSRLLISKYYLNNNNLNKANKYLIEILKIDSKNKKAKNFLKVLYLKERFFRYLKNNNSSIEKVDKFYKKLYLNKKYKEIENNAKYMQFLKNDYPKLITAKILMKNGKYQKSENILKLVKNKKTLDYIEIKAYDCYYLKNYKCAKENFSTLYSATYKLQYAYKLIDIYFYLNDVNKADYLISKLLELYPNITKLKKYREKLFELKKYQLNKLKKIYKKDENFSNLQKIVFILLNSKQNNEAYRLLNDYVSKYPNDENAKYWYATYLSWGNHNNEALYILNKIKDRKNYKVKLLKAKILSWGGEYEKSINYLNDIIVNSNDKKLIIDAKELKGLIYYWKQDYKEAKPILKEVLKYKTSIEIEEALMNINGNIKPLIKKYNRLYKKDKNNIKYILKIAQFSEKIKDINRAIKFYEKAYAINPTIEIAHSLGRLYLLKNNPYKAFSYYEYWAYKVNSENSLFELAKSYYYAGYNMSALSVLEEILKRYPNSKKAIDLKAKILKIEPRFLQNNSSITIKDIFDNKSKKVLKLANRLYFNGHYYEAIDYFKKYLLDNSDNYKIRKRYAYALQFIGNYKKASGEFFLLTWKKKDCNTFYHYAFNLEKAGQKKKAEDIYKKAKEYAIKPLDTNSKLKKFIYNWKKAKESLNIKKYKNFYSKKIRNNKIWLITNKNIFRKTKFISLYLTGKSIILEKKYKNFTLYKVKFFQKYTTNKRVTQGYKTLTIKCNENRCLIYNEKWQKGKFRLPNYVCYNNLIKPKKIRTLSMHELLKKIKINNDENDITLAEGLKKSLSDEKEVFATFDVNLTNKFNFPKKKNKEKNNLINEKGINKVGILGYYYKENTGLSLLQYGAYYKDKLIYTDFQKWKLYDNNNERKGKFVTLKVKKGVFTFGGEIGNYEEFNYIYPYLKYEDYFNYKFYQSVFGRDNKSFCAVDNNLSSTNLSISKYKGANLSSNKDITDYWFDITTSKINNNNLIIIPQFQYLINKNNKFYKNKLNVYYYLSGWYVSNSNENSCYYSPKFYDSTFAELHPMYKDLELIGKVGYSFKENASLYSYGFNYQYNNILTLKCMKNYSYKKTNKGYSYIECYLDAGVNW